MADLSEREWARKKIEEKEAELKAKEAELKAVEGKVETELKKPQEERNAELLANWKETRVILRQQWASLHAELQKFQDILAAGGKCVFISYAVNVRGIPPPFQISRKKTTNSNTRTCPIIVSPQEASEVPRIKEISASLRSARGQVRFST